MAFNENSRVKIDALLHLMRLGYTYIPLREQIRRSDSNIFEGLFLESLQHINPDVALDDLKRLLDELSLELDYEDISEILPAQNRYDFIKRLTI